MQRGGTVQSIELTTAKGEKRTVPNGEGRVHQVPEELVVNLLGRTFTDDELEHAINRMGGRFDGRKPASKDAPMKTKKMAQASAGTQELLFTMPRWRFDILHPVDLVEELAIGHGYEDLGEDLPQAQLTAKPREDHNTRRRLRDAMQGLGMMQIQSLTLSNEEDQFTHMRWQPEHAVTTLTNPITVDHTILRQHLLPGLLRLLASNRHMGSPHRWLPLQATPGWELRTDPACVEQRWDLHAVFLIKQGPQRFNESRVIYSGSIDVPRDRVARDRPLWCVRWEHTFIEPSFHVGC